MYGGYSLEEAEKLSGYLEYVSVVERNVLAIGVDVLIDKFLLF